MCKFTCSMVERCSATSDGWTRWLWWNPLKSPCSAQSASDPTGATTLVHTGGQGVRLIFWQNLVPVIIELRCTLWCGAPYSSGECENSVLATLPTLYASVLALKCFDNHLSTKLAFFKVFPKTFLLAIHDVTRSNAYACKSTPNGTR
jgi:hypothetical protein